MKEQFRKAIRGSFLSRTPPIRQILSWIDAARAEPSSAGSERDRILRAVVEETYRSLLGRPPEPEALASHVHALRTGTSIESFIQSIATSQELKNRLPQLLGLFAPPGHFYSPIVDPHAAGQHLAAVAARPPDQPVLGISIDHDAMRRRWAEFLPSFQNMPFAEQPREGMRYGLENPTFSWADGSILYAMIRVLRPRTIIEVGCGWSSLCLIDTRLSLGDDAFELILADPYFDFLESLLGRSRESGAASIGAVTTLRAPVQNLDLSMFERLSANDILFIDSTHIMKTGSDVCHELFQILPRIRSGVYVHFHDIFWPFEYSKEWEVVQGRSWNEAFGIRAFLMSNPEWRIEFFNDYWAKTEPDLIRSTYPDFLKNSGGSLWLRRL